MTLSALSPVRGAQELENPPGHGSVRESEAARSRIVQPILQALLGDLRACAGVDEESRTLEVAVVKGAHADQPLQRCPSTLRLVIDARAACEQHANRLRAAIDRRADERRDATHAIGVRVCATREQAGNEAVGTLRAGEVERRRSFVFAFRKRRCLRYALVNARVDRRTVAEQRVDDIDVALLERRHESLERTLRVADVVNRLEPVDVD